MKYFKLVISTLQAILKLERYSGLTVSVLCLCASAATPQPVVELANSALDSLELTWTVSSAMDVTNYTVYWSEVPSGASGSRTLGKDIMQASISDLRSNTAYTITVQAAGHLGKRDSEAVRYYTAPSGKNAVTVACLLYTPCTTRIVLYSMPPTMQLCHQLELQYCRSNLSKYHGSLPQTWKIMIRLM